ncbi:hypothetical protein [Brenneria rubrifaciens]|uniref:Uncharacterized protein n=1 Tax=Brenneria rubrifaciens TaxID=55213 RepID=A0A4P8QKZ7_9GAMM|nr:hypothetical protein [Brenneria rubrifaciens]QCR07752.1 hypothetical protein EH207_03890 [Brenneria rubrifaciens]
MRVGSRIGLLDVGGPSGEGRQSTSGNQTRRLTRSAAQRLAAQQTTVHSVVEFGTSQLRDEDRPYKKRLSIRNLSEAPQGTNGPPLGVEAGEAQSSSTRKNAKSNVEKDLWHDSQQRREEFGGLLSAYNRSLSGPAFLKVIRQLTDAAQPLNNVRLPTERDDIRLYSVFVPGSEDNVYVLRRDTGGELRDLRRLSRPDDEKELRGLMAQMEKSAFQSYGLAAAARGKSTNHPHLSDLWISNKRRQEFQPLYAAYRKLPGKLDVTGSHFLDTLYKLTIEEEKRGSGQKTDVADIRLFTIRVPGTPNAVQVLRRLDASGGLADIRLASQTSLEETLDQMADSRRNSASKVLSGPRKERRDRYQLNLWKKHLAPRLADEWARFRRTQSMGDAVDSMVFIRHLNELCDKNPGDMADRRFGITRHTITPIGSSQPITVLRRKSDGEPARLRVVDSDYSEREAIRSLRLIGPKRKMEAAADEVPSKRRNILVNQRQPREASADNRSSNVVPGRQVHRITVSQQYKEKTVDVTHLITGSVGRLSGGPRALESAYANSASLIKAPRSYAGERERQVLRWLSSVMLNAFTSGMEVQAYYDRVSDEIWISSNARGTNRKMRMLLNENGLQGELQKQLQAAKSNPDTNDRWLRHAMRLEKMLNDRSVWPPDAQPVLEAIVARRFRVSSENFHFNEGGQQIDLHAEHRIKRAFENATGRMLESDRIVGTKRTCGTCAEALQFSDSQQRGPFWQTRAASASINIKAAIRNNIAKGIPTYISRDRNGALNLNVSDSDSDA